MLQDPDWEARYIASRLAKFQMDFGARYLAGFVAIYFFAAARFIDLAPLSTLSLVRSVVLDFMGPVQHSAYLRSVAAPALAASTLTALLLMIVMRSDDEYASAIYFYRDKIVVHHRGSCTVLPTELQQDYAPSRGEKFRLRSVWSFAAGGRRVVLPEITKLLDRTGQRVPNATEYVRRKCDATERLSRSTLFRETFRPRMCAGLLLLVVYLPMTFLSTTTPLLPFLTSSKLAPPSASIASLQTSAAKHPMRSTFILTTALERFDSDRTSSREYAALLHRYFASGGEAEDYRLQAAVLEAGRHRFGSALAQLAPAHGWLFTVRCAIAAGRSDVSREVADLISDDRVRFRARAMNELASGRKELALQEFAKSNPHESKELWVGALASAVGDCRTASSILQANRQRIEGARRRIGTNGTPYSVYILVGTLANAAIAGIAVRETSERDWQEACAVANEAELPHLVDLFSPSRESAYAACGSRAAAR